MANLGPPYYFRQIPAIRGAHFGNYFSKAGVLKLSDWCTSKLKFVF